jgi:hypothetical protein
MLTTKDVMMQRRLSEILESPLSKWRVRGRWMEGRRRMRLLLVERMDWMLRGWGKLQAQTQTQTQMADAEPARRIE